MCREKVVVPSVSLPRGRRKQPPKGEAAPIDLSLAGAPRAFEQLAAEFLTRETEIGIAEKMAAISEQAARKKAPPPSPDASSDAPPDVLSDAPPTLELPQPPPTMPYPAMPAATVAGAPLAAASPAEVPALVGSLPIEPTIGAAATDDQALFSFFASAAPLPSAAQAPRVSPASAPPSLPMPPPPPVPPPIAAMVASPPAAVAAPAVARTAWWTWATRDTLGQYPVYRPAAGQLEITYWLASLLPFAIVLCAAPAVSHLRLNAAPAWAQAMLLLAGAQLVYAVWLALLVDYSTLRVGMSLFAASAALYGLAILIVLSKPAWFGLSAGGSAAAWCAGCLAIMAGLSYACAKIGARWL